MKSLGRLACVALVGAVISALTGAASLLLWAAAPERSAKLLLTDRILMAPVTAASFFIMGSGLVVFVIWRHSRRLTVYISRVAAVLVALIAITILAEYFFGFDSGMKQMLPGAAELKGGAPPSHMSPDTAVLFLLTSASLFLLSFPSRWPPAMAGVLGGLANIAGFILTFGYLYGTPFLHSGQTISMSAETAATFMVLGSSLGIAAGRQYWPLRLLVGKTTRARLLRAYVPAAVAIFIAQGLLERFYIMLFPEVNTVLVEAFFDAVVAVLVISVLFRLSQTIGGSIDKAVVEHEQMEMVLRGKDDEIRRAYTEVIDAVTGGKLVLLTDDEIENELGRPLMEEASITDEVHLADARKAIAAAMESSFDDAQYLLDHALVPFSEALTNAIKHAGSGSYQLRRVNGTAQICVRDGGPGIDFENLPRATLLPGYSTVGTLGFGFTIMLNESSRVLLATRPGNTFVVIEMMAERV